MRFPRLGQEGFTLLETLIAMTIMLVAFTSIYSVQSASLNASAKAKRMNVVGMLAAGAMAKTEIEIQGKAFNEIKEEESGAFEAPYEDYTWVRKVKEIKFPNVNLLMSAGSKEEEDAKDQGNSGMMEQMAKLVSNYVSKALREVSIEIKWKRGGSEQSYRTSMYWVDFNTPFELN